MHELNAKEDLIHAISSPDRKDPKDSLSEGGEKAGKSPLTASVDDTADFEQHFYESTVRLSWLQTPSRPCGAARQPACALSWRAVARDGGVFRRHARAPRRRRRPAAWPPTPATSRGRCRFGVRASDPAIPHRRGCLRKRALRRQCAGPPELYSYTALYSIQLYIAIHYTPSTTPSACRQQRLGRQQGSRRRRCC